MDSCVVVNNLGKKYKRYTNRWHRIMEWKSRGKVTLHQPQWVLRNISFSVKSGQSLGLVGQNGAGKSTLLKILTGTTQMSEGSYDVKGRVSALLELGMGFYPEFTGRQNVFLTGQIMGFGNEQIQEMMPEVQSFAEIGDYFDQPIRTYSSGMIVRLAFAAATAVRPEVLIVDEALSVGDAYFQHKCFARLRKFKEQGTTLLFVSHDPGAVKNLCDRAILLDGGQLIKEGYPEEILDYYNAVIATREAGYAIQQNPGEGNRMITRSGDGAARISQVEMLCKNQVVNAVQVGDMVDLRVKVGFLKEVIQPTVGILFKDRLGNDIFGTNTYNLGLELGTCKAGEEREVIFRMPINFGAGHYSLTAAVHHGPTHLQGNYDWWEHAVILQVVPGKESQFIGVCYLPVTAVLTDNSEFYG
ncbi:ABC transporter ATP-binding protein [Candidatus Contubernalis alkaliaceticus]|uniref:ABC transporter ATP-binding protein n=1 Tax=Candidatus Contubernalis alkaliaceticus TaxID=338645 RepID=UPI001F4BF510|nr:ABC transporter ATP-binding protein [Candidatus Contubernalis alkalaceticus]UNC93606.1 ABC transporter ATP-binding protein [Candidatus Contubernalis alkalaceticus]